MLRGIAHEMAEPQCFLWVKTYNFWRLSRYFCSRKSDFCASHYPLAYLQIYCAYGHTIDCLISTKIIFWANRVNFWKNDFASGKLI